uniref:ATP synthase subunit e, mitochondrial n=1 Tax=Salix viminalis TaxID=40686 RepID=A0A6N2LD99_SALVM
MPTPPGPYSGASTLALVARASAFSFGLVYGSVKLKILKIAQHSRTNKQFITVLIATDSKSMKLKGVTCRSMMKYANTSASLLGKEIENGGDNIDHGHGMIKFGAVLWTALSP